MFNTTQEHTRIDGRNYYRCDLQAGEVIYSFDPSLICAVCGNGVLVTVQDPYQRFGGMAHCVYPQKKAFQQATNLYSDCALMTLYTKLTEKNRLSKKAVAQIFGGGHFFGMKKERAETVIDDVRRILAKLKIPIVSEDIGGTFGRKVIFNTYSGEAVVLKTQQIRKSDWLPERPRV